MASMTFQVNDASTSTGYPAVWVTITENADGTLAFSVTQQGGLVGDLRGLYFDVADERLIGTLRTSASTSDFRQGNDSIADLGDGASMNGLAGSNGGYDAGIEVGSAGIGADDIQSYSFTLGSTARPLTLADFANVDFGVRLTSVGTLGGAREDSSKILETTSVAVDARDDTGVVHENTMATGNLLANDATGGGTSTLTGWSGGALGETVELADSTGVTLTLNADGTWTLDASVADELSQGEQLTYTFQAAVRNQTEATSWSDDTATFTVVVHGANDDPVAQDDSAGRIFENESLSGNVAENDWDPDRLDSPAWSLVQGSFNGRGELVFNDDGTWRYDAAGAYDGMSNGEEIQLSFQYAITDDHGARDTAWVSFVIDGSGEIAPPPPPPPSDPSLEFLFNHGTKRYDHGWFPKLGDDTAEDFTANDTLKIAGYGDLKSITIVVGDFGLGDPNVADTKFVLGIHGNGKSTRTEDVGYLADYASLDEDQIHVTGNDQYDLIYAA